MCKGLFAGLWVWRLFLAISRLPLHFWALQLYAALISPGAWLGLRDNFSICRFRRERQDRQAGRKSAKKLKRGLQRSVPVTIIYMYECLVCEQYSLQLISAVFECLGTSVGETLWWFFHCHLRLDSGHAVHEEACSDVSDPVVAAPKAGKRQNVRDRNGLK